MLCCSQSSYRLHIATCTSRSWLLFIWFRGDSSNALIMRRFQSWKGRLSFNSLNSMTVTISKSDRGFFCCSATSFFCFSQQFIHSRSSTFITSHNLFQFNLLCPNSLPILNIASSMQLETCLQLFKSSSKEFLIVSPFVYLISHLSFNLKLKPFLLLLQSLLIFP